ncbi:MAG TPA: integrase arm-type DNA-binding domain-containing protein [Nitrococcus sp.]|nr:integrase arm-type DNA-binding domain-containing protein [Nitrococcus sp.]
MPKRARELSALEVRRLTTPGLHAVGGVVGLQLRISDTNARYWVLRTTIAGRRRDIGIGPYPEVTLAQARVSAAEARAKARAGIDPVAERRAARDALLAAQGASLTFDEAAKKCIAAKRREFRNPKHAAQWSSTLDAYASPVIGKLPVAAVELAHIVTILEPIWTTKTETATRLRGRIEAVLAWATVSGYRSGENPARWKGHLDAVLPKPRKVAKVRHHKALPWQEIGRFVRELRSREGLAARALEFLILTATRSGEVRGATWDEISLAQRLWTIPAHRIKAGREHRVPLSDAAVALLEALPRFVGSKYVFPAARGGALSDMSLSAVMKRMSTDAVPHGFRSTFRDWCSETTAYPRDVAEMALAHAIPDKVEAAYRRGDLMAKRIQLMKEWARFCSTVQPVGEVVSITRAR